MNRLSIDQAIKAAMKSFDWVLKNKQLLIAIIVCSLGTAAAVAAGVGLSILGILSIPEGIQQIASKLISILATAVIIFYAKDQFEGKQASLLNAAKHLASKFLNILPVITISILFGFLSNFLSKQFTLGSILMYVAIFLSLILGICISYLLSVTIMHHGSFMSAARHWLHRFTQIIPAAIVGNIGFLFASFFITLLAGLLTAAVLWIRSLIFPVEPFFLPTNSPILSFAGSFFFSFLNGLIFVAYAYYMACIGWFSVHNSLPRNFEAKHPNS